ncbi:MAG: hypothetical protein AB1546_07220 [bacterium]
MAKKKKAAKKKTAAKRERKKVIIPDAEEARREYNAIEKLLTRDTERMWKAMGAVVRLAGRTEVGRSLLREAGRAAGAVIAETGMFGVGRGGDAVEVTSEWLKVLAAVGCEYEIGKAGRDEVEVFVLECPAGLSAEDGREVCDAGMSADCELVRRLGGELIIGDTIATGADCCHLVVRTA